MTTTNETIASLASLIIHHADPDPFDMIINMRAILSPAHYTILCLAADICPIHACDIDSCADDDAPECADLRA